MAIYTITDMDLDNKFQKAIEAVETVMMDLDFAKMTKKMSLRRRDETISPHQAVGANKFTPDKAAPDRAKKLKRRNLFEQQLLQSDR